MTEKFLHSEPITRLQEWAIDSHTQQPWSHVLAEPLLQLGRFVLCKYMNGSIFPQIFRDDYIY